MYQVVWPQGCSVWCRHTAAPLQPPQRRHYNQRWAPTPLGRCIVCRPPAGSNWSLKRKARGGLHGTPPPPATDWSLAEGPHLPLLELWLQGPTRKAWRQGALAVPPWGRGTNHSGGLSVLTRALQGDSPLGQPPGLQSCQGHASIMWRHENDRGQRWDRTQVTDELSTLTPRPWLPGPEGRGGPTKEVTRSNKGRDCCWMSQLSKEVHLDETAEAD